MAEAPNIKPKAGAEDKATAEAIATDGPSLWAEHAEMDCEKCQGKGAVTMRIEGKAKTGPCPCTGIDPNEVVDWNETPDIF